MNKPFTLHSEHLPISLYLSLQTDLVLEQVREELQRLRPGRPTSQGLAGGQESRLPSVVAPVHLSAAFQQQAEQTELTRGCRADEGAAV